MVKARELWDEGWRVVKSLSMQGLLTREISRIEGCYFPIISRFLKRFKTKGTFQKSRRGGRPKTIDPSVEWMATRIVKCHRINKLSIIMDELDQCYPDQKVLKRQVKCILHKYHSCARKRKPFVSLEDGRKCVQCSKAPRDWQDTDWENSAFMAESWFSNDSKMLRVEGEKWAQMIILNILHPNS